MSMSFLTVGDLARANLMKLGQARLKSDLMRLSSELTTGKRSEPHPKLGGDITPLSMMERARAAIVPWQGAASEAAITFDAAQAALDTLQATASSLTLASLDADLGNEADIARLAGQARGDFERMVATLNTATAGRSLFAGTATDGPALVPGEAILGELNAAALAAGAVTATDLIAVIDSYFADGGGFDTSAYAGSAAVESVRIGPRDAVSALPTAQSAGIRATLRAAAIAALAGDEALGLAATDRKTMIETAALDLANAESGLISLRATLGRGQEVIETAETRMAAEANALDQAIADLTAADPYATASALEATQVQLETLYAVQARISSMGLAGYLR